MTEGGDVASIGLDDLAIATAPAGRAGQDRATGLVLPEGYLMAVADGAGGVSGGTTAAERVIARAWETRPSSVADCASLLARLDTELDGVGETTAIIAVVTRDRVFGASVGDSEAWMVGGDAVVLTRGQKRKPLIGSGAAVPVGFGPVERKGRLVLGTDGLFRYVASERIHVLASSASSWVPLASRAQARRSPRVFAACS